MNRNKVVVNASNVDIFRKLTALPNCRELRCVDLGLTELPALPQCEILDCTYNQITELPALPQCTELHCYHNQITELPALPKCLLLDCFSNQILELPSLPECRFLDCSHNQITVLPELPNCIELDCSYNLITQIPELLHCPDPIYDHNPILPPAPLYQINRAWWNSQQQRQTKQQIKQQLTQQQKKQVQRTDPISLQQFQSPALGNDFAIYDDSTLTNFPFKGMRGLDVTSNLPLKQAVKKYNTQQDPVKKRNMKKDIAKYVALLQTLRGYGLQELFGQQ